MGATSSFPLSVQSKRNEDLKRHSRDGKLANFDHKADFSELCYKNPLTPFPLSLLLLLLQEQRQKLQQYEAFSLNEDWQSLIHGSNLTLCLFLYSL